MSGDSKFFVGVIIAAVLVVGGIVVFSHKSTPASVSADQLDYSVGQKLGPDTAPVKIVEFGDFECPACAAARADLETAVKSNPTTVQLIFRHFPLPQHQNAIPAAVAAESAGTQSKFWDMYDLLYANQAEWVSLNDPTDTFVNFAKQLNLNADQFKKDLSSTSLKKVVTDDQSYGVALGINETPTFYVNKVKYTGGRTAADWQSLIDAAKAATSTNP